MRNEVEAKTTMILYASAHHHLMLNETILTRESKSKERF